MIPARNDSFYFTVWRPKQTACVNSQHFFFTLCYFIITEVTELKFQMIIDPKKDEEITATVHAPSALTEKIQQLVQEYTGTDRVAAYADDDIQMLPFAEIACITVIDGKTVAVDGKGRQYRLKQRLYELEAILPPSFIRINKSAIANERLIERYTASFSGAVDVVFRGGYREYVSRRCFAGIKRRYHL